MTFFAFREERLERERQQEVLEKIKLGKGIWNLEELPEELHALLTRTILDQANDEWWGGAQYFECVRLAPTSEERQYMRELGRQEQGHAHILARGSLAALGVDFFAQLAASAKEQKPILEIFTHPEEFISWADVVAFNVVQDGGADIQLQRFKQGPFGKWSVDIERLEAEETGHREHGERWVKKLSSTNRGKYLLQLAFQKWLPRALRAFGAPDATSKSLPLYKKYNLKDSNDVQRHELIVSIRPLLDMCGYVSPILLNPELAWSSEFL